MLRRFVGAISTRESTTFGGCANKLPRLPAGVNAVRIDPSFEAHLKAKTLIKKYWVELFSEYILDQVYPQPELKQATAEEE